MLEEVYLVHNLIDNQLDKNQLVLYSAANNHHKLLVKADFSDEIRLQLNYFRIQVIKM